MPTSFTYGSRNLNDGINYFVVEKDNLSWTQVQPVFMKVGRLEGMKKTGDVTNEKTITIKMIIVGTSRTDLENKIDTLMASLALKGQNLSLHTNDARFYVADCVNVVINLQKGNVLYCEAVLTFIASQPYAYGSATSQNTGNITYVLVSGTQYNSSTNVTAGGSIFCRPRIHIVKADTRTWTQVQVVQTTDSQTLTITSNLPSANGDYIDIYCDPNAANGFSVVKNGATQCAFNGVFPVIEPTSTTFTIYITCSIAGAPVANTTWFWTPRWVS